MLSALPPALRLMIVSSQRSDNYNYAVVSAEVAMLVENPDTKLDVGA